MGFCFLYVRKYYHNCREKHAIFGHVELPGWHLERFERRSVAKPRETDLTINNENPFSYRNSSWLRKSREVWSCSEELANLFVIFLPTKEEDRVVESWCMTDD